MTPQTPYSTDPLALAACMWREARGEGYRGMQAVGCVVRNRVARDRSTYFAEVYKPLQFSSMTAPGDPQLHLYPKVGDPQWSEALDIANGIITGALGDITSHATLYYDCSISFPHSWDRSKVQFACKIGRFFFWREL